MLKKLGFQTLVVLGLILISVLMLSKLTSITPVLVTVKLFFINNSWSFLMGRFFVIATVFFSWPFLIKKIQQKNTNITKHYNELLELRWFILLIFVFVELLNYWR